MTTTDTITHIPAGGGAGYQVITDLVRIKVSGEHTGGAFSLAEVIAPPGGGAPLHRHDPAEVFYVLEGTLTVAGGAGDPVVAAAGATVCIPSGVPHAYRNDSQAAVRFLAILAPAGLERFFADLGDPAGDLTVPAPRPGPPDVARIMDAAARHGIELLGEAPPA